MHSVIAGHPKRLLSAAVVLAVGFGAACIEHRAPGQDQAPATEARSKLQNRQPRASIYDKTADAKAQVEKATVQAKRDNKRILLMFGGDWCGWCHKLHGLFASDREIARTLSEEYVLVMIENTAPNADAVLKQCKAELSAEESKKPFGYPFLTVLDATGKVVKAQPTDVLEEGDHHDPKKVLDFLTQFKVPPQDAKTVLEEALSRAASADKRVFLDFGAPWCGWCRRLESWFAQPEVAAIMDRDFVITKIDIDRMQGGKEVMKQYRSSEKGGIPWYTILDARGKSLATSDGPDGNIGYPLKPREIDQFLAMVKGQSKNIGAPELEKLHQSLDEAAAQIEKKSRH